MGVGGESVNMQGEGIIELLLMLQVRGRGEVHPEDHKFAGKDKLNDSRAKELLRQKKASEKRRHNGVDEMCVGIPTIGMVEFREQQEVEKHEVRPYCASRFFLTSNVPRCKS